MLRNKNNTVNTTKSIWHLNLHFPISSIYWNYYDWQVFISEVILNMFMYDKQCYNTMHEEDFWDSLHPLSSASLLGSGSEHTQTYINITHIWLVSVGFLFIWISICFGQLTLSGTTSLPRSLTTDVSLVIICILNEEDMVIIISQITCNTRV